MVTPLHPVPRSERKDPLTMGLVWVTMVTAFPTVMVGFAWFKKGLTLSQVLSCTALSALILLAYQIPAAQLGARSGLSYTALSRTVFGRVGSYLITFNVIWLFTAAYGLVALYAAESLTGLFHWTISIAFLSAVLAMLMSVNNIFGFKGVANFARYLAAPALIGWVIYTFLKSCRECPPGVLTQLPHETFATALMSISSFVVGFGVWGNEMDYWRFSRPKVSSSVVPLTVATITGLIIFPITGWMLAQISGVTEYGAAATFMNQYSFGGIASVAALVLCASYFACNDSQLFGCIQAIENIKQVKHWLLALIIAITGAACAASLSALGGAKSMEIFTSLNCIIMPTPTVIMIAEWFLAVCFFKTDPISKLPVPPLSELPLVRTPACLGLLSGLGVGLLTGGIIPGTEKFNIGITSGQAWLTALLVYIPLRMAERRKEVALQSHKSLERAFELETEPEHDMVT